MKKVLTLTALTFFFLNCITIYASANDLIPLPDWFFGGEKDQSEKMATQTEKDITKTIAQYKESLQKQRNEFIHDFVESLFSDSVSDLENHKASYLADLQNAKDQLKQISYFQAYEDEKVKELNEDIPMEIYEILEDVLRENEN